MNELPARKIREEGLIMFSKYDLHHSAVHVLHYPDTDVSESTKLNIHDKAELKQAEEEFCGHRWLCCRSQSRDVLQTHLFRIHRFLFEDVYPFAGHIRKEQISKGDTMFYLPDLID